MYNYLYDTSRLAFTQLAALGSMLKGISILQLPL